jgi:hypothetical protein
MYHGRFKGSNYDAGFKYGSMLKRQGVVYDFLNLEEFR